VVTKKENKEMPVRSDGLKALDFIEVRLDCEWPLEILFDENTQKQYNEIFRFLMKVKRAIYLT
jgi:hypothetical protein